MRRVFITGIGAVTPYGTGVEALKDGLLSGRSAVRTISSFDASRLPVRIGGELPPLDVGTLFDHKERPWVARLSLYTVASAREALADAAIETLADPDRGGVYVGTGFGTLPESAEDFYRYREIGDRAARPTTIPRMMPNGPPAQVALKLGLRGPNLTVSTACSSGSHAIGLAYREIREGRADLMLAGGAETALSEEMLLLWTRLRVLSRRNDAPAGASRPFDRARDGFVLSDASVMFVLEAGESVARRGGSARAEIVGYAASCDASHLTAPQSQTQAACMRNTLADADLEPGAVDWICAHGTGTRLNDATEAEAIRDVFGAETDRIRVSAVKSMIGHTMGASGAVSVAAAVFGLESGLLPPTINLDEPDPACRLRHVANTAELAEVRTVMVNAFGFGGTNAAVMLCRA